MGDRWVGVDAFLAGLKKVSDQAEKASKTIVSKGGLMVTREAQANFQGSHRQGQPHVGDDKPNIVSGDLRRSIRPDPVVRVGLFEYATTVGPRLLYGRAVELGYMTRRAFPYFMPAATKVQPQLRALAEETWAEFLRN
jgi:hypothetical protein